MKSIPVLMLFRDHVGEHPRWAAYRTIDIAYADAIRAVGDKVDVVALTDVRITGNSPMTMEKNNGAIADLIDRWLVRQSLAS